MAYSRSYRGNTLRLQSWSRLSPLPRELDLMRTDSPCGTKTCSSSQDWRLMIGRWSNQLRSSSARRTGVLGCRLQPWWCDRLVLRVVRPDLRDQRLRRTWGSYRANELLHAEASVGACCNLKTGVLKQQVLQRRLAPVPLPTSREFELVQAALQLLIAQPQHLLLGPFTLRLLLYFLQLSPELCNLLHDLPVGLPVLVHLRSRLPCLPVLLGPQPAALWAPRHSRLAPGQRGPL